MNYLTNYYKNLSEQLQDRLNYLQKLLNENAEGISPFGVEGTRAIHNRIVDSIVKHHASKYPHKRAVANFETNVKESSDHIREILNNHKDAPFTDPLKAIRAIHGLTIEGNPSLESRLYDGDFIDRTRGGDVSELPQDEYEELTMENEGKYAEELHGKVVNDLVGDSK